MFEKLPLHPFIKLQRSSLQLHYCDTDNQKLDSDSGHHIPFLYTLKGILKQIHCHKLIVKSIYVTLHQNKKSGNKEKIPSFVVMEYLAKFVFTEVVKVGDENVGEPS